MILPIWQSRGPNAISYRTTTASLRSNSSGIGVAYIEEAEKWLAPNLAD